MVYNQLEKKKPTANGNHFILLLCNKSVNKNIVLYYIIGVVVFIRKAHNISNEIENGIN